MRRTLAPALGVLAGLVSAMAGAVPAAAADRVGALAVLTDSGRLVQHDVGTGAVTRDVAITGLGAERLIGIDVRPATGQLYAISAGSRLFVLDPTTGAATAIGTAPFAPALDGDVVGFDFNPTVDRIRVVTVGDQNLRLHPDTGAAAATDTPLAYATGDAANGANPSVSGAGYTNSVAGSTATVLFDIDAGRDVLATQVPPNNGTLNTVGTLGVDATDVGGFDIGPRNQAFAALTVGGTSQLHRVDLATGRATSFATAGVAGSRAVGLAVLPVVDRGYWLVSASGDVVPAGEAAPLGSTPRLARPAVGVASTPSGDGYWVAAADGGVVTFGDARFFGSAGSVALAHPVTGIAATPSGLGYWLVARDGGIFAYGDARFFGSTGAVRLAQPIVGMVATPTGLGYWLVAADGGVFTFGDAAFFGSTGAVRLAQPVVGMAATLTGRGYWLLGADGGVFTFGDAAFLGSAAAPRSSSPAVAIVRTSRGNGYWIARQDGTVAPFGAAPARANARPATGPVVGIATI